jgi:sulfonate dioxygenase
VRTHPVTGLKALNVNPGFVTGFAELKKRESGTSESTNRPSPSCGLIAPRLLTGTDSLLSFIDHHIHSADDHYVRWKWAVGSVAMWDNRVAVHRVIPGTYKGNRKGIRTTVFGKKRKFSRLLTQCLNTRADT